MKGSLVRGAALFVTLETAKLVVCLLRMSDGARVDAMALLSIGGPSAMFALGFTAFDLAVSRAAASGRPPLIRARVASYAMWTIYSLVAAYAAVNVPITRVFASPLTASMREATGTAIADSMARYATAGTLGAVMLVGLVAIMAPRLTTRRRGFAVAAMALALITTSAAWLGGGNALAVSRDPVVTIVRTELARLAASRGAGVASSSSSSELAAEDDSSTRGLDLEHLAGAARGRHVVWIVLESTGARYLSAHGAANDPTPHLTRLARQGIVFENAYAVYPESIKGLYAMLCSFAPAPHTAARAYDAARLPCRSIAQTLKAEGYATSLFHSGRFAYLGMNHIVQQRGFDLLADAKTVGGKHASSFGTDDMSTARAVLARFDARQPGERVFASYMPIAGHHPYESPGEGPRPFGEHDDFARYQSDLFRGDLALGALIEGLQQRGLWEDTLFVIHGDHGEAFFQHDGNFAHTLFAYDENLHVPFVVVAPGVVPGGIRARQLVSLLDVAPTIAALVGAPADPRWQGRSALGASPRVVRSLSDHTTQKLALRTGRHKLVLDVDADRAELFDLVRDPDEKVNRVHDDPKRVEAMREDLLRWADRQRATVHAGSLASR